MNTCMIISITNPTSTPRVSVFIVPLNCNPSDQVHIKRVIESQKNDPRTLLALMTHNTSVPLYNKVKPVLDNIKALVENCESIEIFFLGLTEEDKRIRVSEQDAIVHNFHEN